MTFELQPSLNGRLLTLAPLTERDFEALYEAARDPLIWEQHPYNTRWQRDAFERFFTDAIASGGALSITDNEGGALIGTSRYAGYDAERSEVEIGWTFLVRARWGGSYNSELKALMLDHAFRYVNTVIFQVGEHNIRSQKAVEKLGATRTGSEAAADGTPHVAYRLARANWTAQL
jgi:RimJ/RimL family protein N-acetyltransferase